MSVKTVALITVRKKVARQLKSAIGLRALEYQAKLLLEAMRCERELSILITDDREIRKLNRDFRFKDKATDVLSFPMEDDFLLGDVVISLDTAKRQAKEFNCTVKAELQRLLVHGLLHLLGYEHVGVSAAVCRRMQRKEKALLRLLPP